MLLGSDVHRAGGSHWARTLPRGAPGPWVAAVGWEKLREPGGG